MFKNYHIVIFKDREGEHKDLHLRGWLSIAVFCFLLVLLGLNGFLWQYYLKASRLERELNQATEASKNHDMQIRSLTNKLVTLEQDIERVRVFDTKLRMLMNIGEEQERSLAMEQGGAVEGAFLANPRVMAMHRELFARQIHALADELSVAVNLEELSQQRLVNFMNSNTELVLSTPSIWPAQGFLSSSFGGRASPFTGRGQSHKGVDIANRIGTPILAPARGVVTFVGQDGAYGLAIVIDHGNNLTTRYAHLSRASVVDRQYVQRGEVIGAMGNSGRSTGPHLHYEVRVGNVPVDPMRYIVN